MSRPLVVVSLILGIVLGIVAVIYLIEPASGLPSFFPGHDAAGTAIHHTKHAIGAGILALALFAFAWFQSKPRKVT